MNKKAIKKIGFGAIFLSVAILFVLTIIYSNNSIANSSETTYVLGEKVKVSFDEFENSQNIRVKINSPNKEYITKIGGNSLVYKPEEIGEHTITIFNEVEKREVKFNVIDNLNNTPSKFNEPIESIEQIMNQNDKINNNIINRSEDIIVINKEVKWTERVLASSKIKLNSLARNISLYEIKGGEKIKLPIEKKENMFSNIMNVFSTSDYEYIKTPQTDNELELNYFTPAPIAEESILSENKRNIKITSPKGIDYANVLAYSNITEKIKNSQKGKISIYWKEENKYVDFKAYDLNDNGYIDYIEWIVPHLSEQNFEIILVTKAEHIDRNKNFLEDIYEQIKEIDNIFSPTINEGEYVKVTFEKNLTNENDITLLPKIIYGNPILEVYDSNDNKIAEFTNLMDSLYNKVYLTNLVNSGDSFYIKVVNGGVQFDNIIDPTAAPGATTDLRAQTCAAEDTTNTKGSFIDACDGTYPSACGAAGDLLSCRDTTNVETHTAQNNKYAGVRISTYNTSVTDCATITSVKLCYEWWSSSTSVADCDISVDSNGGSNYTAVTTNCPGTGTNPGLTCTDVSSLESWTCSNFFGASGTRAFAKSELHKSTTGSAITITWDSLFFNVTYDKIVTTDPAVILYYPSENMITNSFVNFSFNVSSINAYRNCSLWDDSSGTFRLNKTNSTYIRNGLYNYISNNYSDGTYKWNILCCSGSSCEFASSNRTFSVDKTPPIVNLIYPLNNSNISDSFNLFFIYNVSDSTSSISNCSILIDNNIKQTLYGIVKDVNQTFYQYVENGLHNFSVHCTDNVGNIGHSTNRTINVSIYQPAFSTGRFYETYPSSFGAETASIWLNETRDATENSNSFSVTGGQFINLVNASTWFMSNNGGLIPAGTTVTFSASFSASHNSVEATWKLYIVNETGQTLLCQNGDDSSGGTPLAGSISSQNTTCINRDIRLQKSDRILMVMDIFNTGGTTRTVTHAWDAATSSYLDINITSEGFIKTNLSYPAIDPNVALNSIFNATCTTNCSLGFCRNVYVYIEQNTSNSGWTRINATSGNLILNTGQTNPINLGNITSSSVNTNFTLRGNAQSVNNIRCVAQGSYDSVNGSNYTQVTVTSAGATSPAVNLTSPINGTWLNKSIISLFYNASDINDNIANSTLILNGIINQTNQSAIINGQINNFTLTLADGIYNWTVNVTDTTSLSAIDSLTRWFYIDTKAPQIDLTSPGNGEIFQKSNIEFNFTASDLMDDFLTCNITIDSVVRKSNFQAQNGSNTNSTISGLTIGTHFWNVTCFDNANNTNTSETRNFTVEDLPPSLELITQNNNFFNSSTISLLYNATDNNGFIQSTLILNGIINQTNQSAIINGQINNFTLTLADGIYNWTVNVTDTGGQNATNITRTFTIDTKLPNVTLNLPITNSNLTYSNVNFSFTAYDNLDSLLECNLTLDSAVIDNMPAQNGNMTSKIISNIPDGLHYWNVTCFDNAKNSNTSETRALNISENPKLILITPPNSYFNFSSINLTYNPTDNTNLSKCELYVDGSLNKTNSTYITNNANNIFSVNNLNEGVHTWYVKCFDYIGLSNTSETRTFTIDLGGLNVTLISPSSGLELFADTLNLVYNVTDNIDTSLRCDIRVNSELLDSYYATSGQNTAREITFSSGGLKIWNVSCWDSSNNMVISQTWNFTLAFAPKASLIFPQNGNWLNYSNIVFKYNASDDNNNIANSTLILNGIINQTNQSAIINGQINNFTLTLADGAYDWTVNVSDLSNLFGTATKNSFYVDTKSPTINTYIPYEGQIVDWNNITFNFTVIDNLDSVLNCTIYIDEAAEPGLEYFAANNGTNTIKYSTRQDGNFSWSVGCIDEAGNQNITKSINFTVEAPPNVTLITPLNNAFVNSSDVTFTYYPEDAWPNGVYNCSFILDEEYNSSEPSPNNNQNNIFQILGIAEGYHNWTVECRDVYPDFNVFRAPKRNITIDETRPNVTLLYPQNNINILRNYVFNFTAQDNLDENLSCNLYVDGKLNKSNMGLENSSIKSITLNNISLGVHNWSVSCFDNANNTNATETRTFIVTIPDLTTNTTSIYFNNTSPKENQTTLITSTIYNMQNISISNVIVRFYLGNPLLGGTQIGNDQMINVLALSSENVSVEWGANIGYNTIFVLIDPPLSSNGTIEESNETNNQANKTIEINGWHYVYGDINSESEFQLADNDANNVITWNANFSSGNIYVSDYESLIYWPSLKPIGKNLTGQNTTNDFSDIDTLLNMTGFSDSVYTIFTNTGQIKNTSAYKIFNRNIDEIPIADSINNSNFVTGILWDSSDDTNSEFDTVNKEDIVFVTNISQNLQGAYGIYDYEIRIPAKLRGYKGNEISGVSFYTEIY